MCVGTGPPKKKESSSSSSKIFTRSRTGRVGREKVTLEMLVKVSCGQAWAEQ